jgi:hypothetical protein
MLYHVHLSWTGFKFTTLVVIGTDCIGSYKSSYYTTTTALYGLQIRHLWVAKHAVNISYFEHLFIVEYNLLMSFKNIYLL